jgi:hypothetical protein
MRARSTIARWWRWGDGLSHSVEGGLGYFQECPRGGRSECVGRIRHHRRHHEGLAFGVSRQIAEGQHAWFGPALEPDGGPLRLVEFEATVVHRENGRKGRRRALTGQLLQSRKGAADVTRRCKILNGVNGPGFCRSLDVVDRKDLPTTSGTPPACSVAERGTHSPKSDS